MRSEADFDPYREWLLIEEPQRPLNAYQLLALKPLDSDFARVRGAITRQRARIEAKQKDAPPELWQRVNDELEQAIALLLDPDRRILLDATLKRQMNGRLTTTKAGPSEGGKMASRPETVKCRGCDTTNAGTRRYCSGCGAPLFDQCPTCKAEVAADERFCGHCGTNLGETLRAQEETYEEKFAKARQLHRTYQFDASTAILRSIALTEDARFEKFANLAIEAINRFSNERKELEDRAIKRLEKAKRYLASQSYEKAVEKLEGIPEPLRTTEALDLLKEATSKRNEVLELGGEIREGLSENRRFDLLPKIGRLLALKPDHAQALQLAQDIRDQICKSAKKMLIEHRYDEARLQLEAIPDYVTNEVVQKLLDRAAELDAITTDIRLSPVVDDPLVGLAERLLKISAGDDKAQKQVQELKAKRATRPVPARLACPAWSNAPQRTLLGLGVEWLAHITRREASKASADVLQKHPGIFFTAFGLALQAIEQAKVPINLLPEEKGRLLDRISFFRKSQPRSGWGLDLSSSGLKAVKLAPAFKDGAAVIEAVEFIPHGKPLSQIDDDIERSDNVLATLRTFIERYPLAKDVEKRDRIAVGVPGSRILGRFFDLPPVAAKKLVDLVTYEARHQIPVPLEELNWGYRVLREAEGKLADESPRHAMLVAAKDFHVKERVQQFRAAEIPVDLVSAEPVAIHNAMHYEFFSEGQTGSVAVVDLGSDSCNFLVSSADGLWFRASGNGGDDFTNALVREFQLTTTAAEQLKFEPAKAPRFSRMSEAWKPLFVKLGSEIERSIGSYNKILSERSIEKLYLTGGAAATHGVLRYLIHGR